MMPTPTPTTAATTTAFAVLAEPNRRRILDLLLAEERPVGALVDALSVSQPAISKHLRVLREAGLVESRTDAQRRIYRVRTDPLQELDAWLRPYRERFGPAASEIGPRSGHPYVQ